MGGRGRRTSVGEEMAREIGRQDQAWGESGPEDQENEWKLCSCQGSGMEEFFK